MPGQSLWILGISPSDARLAASGVLATNSNDPGDIRQGVLYTGQPLLVGATSSLSVSVIPLHFVATKGYSNGAYLGFNPAINYPSVPAAPTVGLKRIDVLYVVQQDPNALVSADPTGVNACIFGVKQGVASSSPSKPALTDVPAAPVGAIEIGTITWDSTTSVPTATNASTPGASCTVATTCQWTASRGAPIPVRNSTELAALNQYDGMEAFRLDLGITQASYGGVWRSTGPFAQADGTLPVATSSGTPNVANTINFPAGIFTQPPVVQVSWQSNSGSEPMIRTFTITTTSFGVNVISAPADIGPVTGTLHWTATQATNPTA